MYTLGNKTSGVHIIGRHIFLSSLTCSKGGKKEKKVGASGHCLLCMALTEQVKMSLLVLFPSIILYFLFLCV